MKRKIKNKHVLIIAAGSMVKKYWDKINRFIKENNVVIVGCNSINQILVPDYHFWGSTRRWKKYGKNINKNSILILPPNFAKKMIRKYWKDSYKIYNPPERLPGSNTKIHKIIYYYFKNITMVAILWAYQKKASKISIVGMDGYTFYVESQLKSKEHSQHCYGKGFTDGQDYVLCRRKDIRNYGRLKNLYKYGKSKYGFYFEIITPTIYVKFYNSSYLNIKEKYIGKKLSFDKKKNLKIGKRKKFIKGCKY